MKKIGNFINGKIVYGSDKILDVDTPLSGETHAQVALTSKDEFNSYIDDIKESQKEWGNQTFKKRAEVIFNFRQKIIENEKALVETIVKENGKTYGEAKAEVSKAVELCEFAVTVPSLISGRTQFVSTGIEAREYVQPLGIVASITPFNFPLMVPMWTIPNVLVCGNAMILKPSEKTPETVTLLANLLKESGLPDGLFNIVQGDKNMVEAICDHKDIPCVTFVGSTPVAEIVYRRASYNLKRCLALGGAKNHILVTDEVDPVVTASEILSAGYGMSGQRCMAASVVLAIGKSDALIAEIVKQTQAIEVGKTLNPLIDPNNVNLIHNFLENTKGEILVDGRDFENHGDENGFYVGPSVVLYDHYNDMEVAEVFGPTLEIVRCETLQEALDYQNQSPYANGASIYTDLGEHAVEATLNLSSGMLGVNVGVPVPRDPFSFGGLKGSKFGVGDITGYNSLPLFTICKKVTTKWNTKHKKDWMS